MVESAEPPTEYYSCISMPYQNNQRMRCRRSVTKMHYGTSCPQRWRLFGPRRVGKTYVRKTLIASSKERCTHSQDADRLRYWRKQVKLAVNQVTSDAQLLHRDGASRQALETECCDSCLIKTLNNCLQNSKCRLY